MSSLFRSLSRLSLGMPSVEPKQRTGGTVGDHEYLGNGGELEPGEPAFLKRLPPPALHAVRRWSRTPLWRQLLSIIVALLSATICMRFFIAYLDYVKLTRLYVPQYKTIPQISQAQVAAARHRHATMDQCLSNYPGLFEEADRTAEFWSRKGGVSQKDISKMATRAQTARVLIYNGEMYIRRFEWERHSRSRATLALIHEAVLTSVEPIPNVEFVIHTDDIGDIGEYLPLWVLSRKAPQNYLWLMPDYGFGSWPEPRVGTYSEVVRKARDYDVIHPWNKKIPQLFWKGALLVEVRKKLINLTQKYSWARIEEVDWRNKETVMTMDEHCGFKYLAHLEGWSYSGRLKYILQCRSVVVAHEMEYIQHFHHLINSTMGSSHQNMVVVPGMEWETLPDMMDVLVNDDRFAEDLADRSQKFWSHYISKQSIDCYWRYLFHKWAEVQRFTPKLHYNDTPYESFQLIGKVHWDPY